MTKMMTKDSEKDLERRLGKEVKALGGKSVKIFNPWEVGLPDRLLLLPGGRVIFVELKSTGEQPRPIQRVKHEELRRLGYEVRVIDRQQQIDELTHDIQTTYIPTTSD